MILSEVVRGRASVETLAGSGASPHTYEPRPSDAQAAAGSLALFYVADGLDAWAARLDAPKRFSLLAMLPKDLLLPGELEDADHAEHDHDHGEFDPHLWSDPLAVKALLPALVEALSTCDPEGRAVYTQNAAAFSTQLDQLNDELKATLAPVKEKPIILFHLSLQYLLHRYGLRLAAVMEPSPGKEASPHYMAQVIDTVRATGAKVVFSEPQLAKRPAQAVAEAAGVALAELDPYGGAPGRDTYATLLRYNAAALRKALE